MKNFKEIIETPEINESAKDEFFELEDEFYNLVKRFEKVIKKVDKSFLTKFQNAYMDVQAVLDDIQVKNNDKF